MLIEDELFYIWLTDSLNFGLVGCGLVSKFFDTYLLGDKNFCPDFSIDCNDFSLISGIGEKCFFGVYIFNMII